MKIVEALMERPLNVSKICKQTGEEQSKISHNLKILKDCHVVDAKIKGKQRIYSLNKDTIVPLMKLVEQHVSRYCGARCMRSLK